MFDFSSLRKRLFFIFLGFLFYWLPLVLFFGICLWWLFYWFIIFKLLLLLLLFLFYWLRRLLHNDFLSIPFIFLSFFPSGHCKIEVLVYFKSRSAYSLHKRFSKFNFREPRSTILAGEQELNWILQTHFTYIYEHGVTLRQPSVFTLNRKSVSFLFFIPILNRIKFQEWLFSIDKFCPYQLIEF